MLFELEGRSVVDSASATQQQSNSQPTLAANATSNGPWLL